MFDPTDTVRLDIEVRPGLGAAAPGRSEGPDARAFGRFRSSAGFTLVELALVVVMIGIVAATVGMKSGWLTSGTNLKTAIDQIAGDLRFLQARAMAVYETTPSPTSRSVTFQAEGNTYNLGGQSRSLPSGVRISKDLALTFNSLGEYSSTADATLTLNAGGVTRTIRVLAISGAVEAY